MKEYIISPPKVLAVLGPVSVAPFVAGRLLHDYPRLAPWAAFLRHFAAGSGSCKGRRLRSDGCIQPTVAVSALERIVETCY